MRPLTTLPLAIALVLESCASTRATAASGWERLEVRDYAGAVALFDEELARAESADSHAGRARALQGMGCYPEALSAYSEALRLEPRHPQWYVGQSAVALALGDAEGAIRSCDRALEMDARLAPARYNRGLARERAGLLAEALTDLTRALELDPGLAEAYEARGLVHARMGRFDAAIDDFGAAVRCAPLSASALANRAVARYAKGECESALADLHAAIKLDRSQPVLYANRGRIYLDLDRPDEAATDFEQALALRPDAARLWLLLSEAHARHGRAEQAREARERALQLDRAVRPEEPKP